MELVYLWVEEYKNIKQQGFNFSPRFTCRFHDEYEKDEDGEERLKENCVLEIKENSDYVNIFPENINVTAIVGENGSGKSGLINFVVRLFQVADKFSYAEESVIAIFDIGSMLYMLHTTPVLTIQCCCSHKIINCVNQQEDKKWNSDMVNLFQSFSYYLYDYHLEANGNLMDYDTHIYPNKNSTIGVIESENKRIFRHLFLKCANEKYFDAYFIPDKLIIKSNKKYNPRINESISRKIFQNIAILSDNVSNFDNVDKLLFIIYTYLGSLLLQFHPKDTFEELREVDNMDKFKGALEGKIKQLSDYYASSKWIEAKSLTYEEDFEKIKTIFKYAKIVKKLKEKLKLSLSIDKSVGGLYHGIELHIDKKFIEDNRICNFLFDGLPNCFELDYISVKNGIRYLDLSSGEKSLLRIWAYIEKKIQTNKQTKLLFLLDEIDAEIHPRWQKETIKYILQILKNKPEKQFHIVLTSHSPFILSDLPKENVIFLKNGAQVYPDIQTFGANIHTLLSHGFFMENGLMGEFAKEKINKAIKYLSEKELTKDEIDYCENIINIIGEPILKRQLQKMLDSKRLSEVEKIKQQIAELQEKLEKHQHAQD